MNAHPICTVLLATCLLVVLDRWFGSFKLSLLQLHSWDQASFNVVVLKIPNMMCTQGIFEKGLQFRMRGWIWWITMCLCLTSAREEKKGSYQRTKRAKNYCLPLSIQPKKEIPTMRTHSSSSETKPLNRNWIFSFSRAAWGKRCEPDVSWATRVGHV